jgi:hypothetical protein
MSDDNSLVPSGWESHPAVSNANSQAVPVLTDPAPVGSS